MAEESLFSLSDIGHAALDGLGFIPVVGAIPDLANAAWYGLEGDMVMAGVSAACAVPLAGDAVAVGKIGVKTAIKATEVGGKVLGKTAVKEGAEQVGKEVAEKTVKETAEKTTKEAAEKTAKETTEKASKEASEKASKDATEKAGKEAAEKTTEETAEKTVKESTEEAAEKTAKSETEKTSKEAVDKATEKTTKESTEKVEKEAVEKIEKEAAEKTTEEAAEKTSKEATEKAGKESTEKVSKETAEDASKEVAETTSKTSVVDKGKNFVKEVREEQAGWSNGAKILTTADMGSKGANMARGAAKYGYWFSSAPTDIALASVSDEDLIKYAEEHGELDEEELTSTQTGGSKGSSGSSGASDKETKEIQDTKNPTSDGTSSGAESKDYNAQAESFINDVAKQFGIDPNDKTLASLKSFLVPLGAALAEMLDSVKGMFNGMGTSEQSVEAFNQYQQEQGKTYQYESQSQTQPQEQQREEIQDISPYTPAEGWSYGY